MYAVGVPIFGLLALAAIALIGFGVVILIWKTAMFFFGALFGTAIEPRAPVGRGPSPTALRCRNLGCGFGNRAGARFCARCGVDLGIKSEVRYIQPPDVNTYG